MGHHLDEQHTCWVRDVVAPTSRCDGVLAGLDAATRALVCDVVW